ncbi:MAG: histidine phosphatase family protein, partial [Candidatus Norongarragalinales archaeon]
QAKELARRLARERIRVVYCSPLKRALETAVFLGRKIVVVPELREIDFGKLTGLSQEEIDARFPGRINKLFTSPNYRLPGGESTAALRKRLQPFVSRLLREREGTVVVVAHNVVNRVIIACLLGLPLSKCRRVKQKNCAITTFFVGERVELFGLDNSVHLVK